MHQCVVYYWYTGGAWPLQMSLGSLVRFGQMWSDVVRCGPMWFYVVRCSRDGE